MAHESVFFKTTWNSPFQDYLYTICFGSMSRLNIYIVILYIIWTWISWKPQKYGLLFWRFIEFANLIHNQLFVFNNIEFVNRKHKQLLYDLNYVEFVNHNYSQLLFDFGHFSDGWLYCITIWIIYQSKWCYWDYWPEFQSG